jgi:thiamine-phosphate pyrophosphorylase
VIVAITDPRYAIDELVESVRRGHALLGDRLVVQVRDRESIERRDETFARVAALGVRTVLNGTAEDALRLAAHGVHLGGESPDIAHARATLGPDAWISIAAHDDAAVARAVAGGATAALVSPIFETPGKGVPRGLDALSRARAIADGRVRIIALGGVDSRRAASCLEAGADGIAVVRSFFDATDALRDLVRVVRPLAP